MYVCLCLCICLFCKYSSRSLSSPDDKLSENIWFVWSKTSFDGDKWRCHYGDKQTNNRKVKIGLVSKSTKDCCTVDFRNSQIKRGELWLRNLFRRIQLETNKPPLLIQLFIYSSTKTERNRIENTWNKVLWISCEGNFSINQNKKSSKTFSIFRMNLLLIVKTHLKRTRIFFSRNPLSFLRPNLMFNDLIKIFSN